ncbi:class I SAM-dependent methyltransferase [Parafilimonas terrae]|jgi:SAM-dependent methyltransferase|uniref:Methyltransferase domain-containing protein n=1 Tax=Parafilimonas terrae TaxID=1465490 RepID=A0A1I5WGF4_9BACT|nr:class I SAM-dependent methyltransferase [Parafilimonas terrae]SFQ18844.1 Methyltransferase domain-containing protein [Parafilimonas terrae]
MFSIVKNVVPISWKTAIRKRFQSEVYKTPGIDQAIIRKIEELEKSVFQLQPEIIIPTNEIKKGILQQWQFPNIPVPRNLSVSKHDYMYQFLKQHYNDSSKAYIEYITSGAHMMNILMNIAKQTGKPFYKTKAFLDFASGYGRLTRYTSELINPKQIWISDIKQGAVEFQVEKFGVNGILSSEDPDAFHLTKQFDLIFVGSLFSHLPDETFGRWLQRIYDLLNDDGLLIFTVHDQSLKENLFLQKQNIVFVPVSEEVNLLSKDGCLPGTQYGMTYVSEDYVNAQIQNLKPKPMQYRRFKKGMWELQDLYIISRKFREDLAGLEM